MSVFARISKLTQSSRLASGALLPHALPQEVLERWEGPLKRGGTLPDVAGPMHAVFPPSQVGGADSWQDSAWGQTIARIKRVIKKAIASVVVVSLQIGAVSPLGHALAQSGSQQPGFMRTPNTGYAPNGDLYINAQRIGLSQDAFHQQQHNNEVPGLFMVDAVQFSYPVTDPSHGQGTLAQMENHTVNLGLPAFDILFTRLYMTVENPYPTTAVSPPNFDTYRTALLTAQTANYAPLIANDGVPYVFKTLTSPNAATQNLLVRELPTHPNFQGALERPNGTPAGAVGVRVGLNGEMAALQEYVSTTKPYDFSYQSAMGPYAAGATTGQRAVYNPNGALAIDPLKDTASFFMNWTLGSNDVQSQLAQAQKNGLSVESALGALVYDNVTGRYYIPTGGPQEGQTNIFDANFLAMAAPEQTTVTGGRNDGAVITGESSLPEWDQLNQAQKQSQGWQQEQQTIARTQSAQTGANSIDFSQFQSPNALFGQGYDLYRYNAQQNPNGQAENALMRRLMNGELAPGTPEYEQAESIAQQRYREQYAHHQITGAKLSYSVTDAQAQANGLRLDETNPNELFGQGFNLFNYAQSEEDKSLLRRLQAGELVVGSDEYDRAAAAARQAFRNAYADHLANGTKKTYNGSAASYQANKLDLTDASVTELFGSGFDLHRWAKADEERSLLRRLQSGELRQDTDEYKKALALAQQYYRNAYAEMLNPPPPPKPKKVPKWKKIVAVVLGAVATFLTGGAIGGIIGPIIGSFVGTVVSTAVITGDIGLALKAGYKALASASVSAIVKNILSSMMGIAIPDLEKLLGLEKIIANIGINALTSATTNTLMNGGNFGDNLAKAVVNSVVDEVGKYVATEIGANAQELGSAGVEVAHGLLGCATALARGGNSDNCQAGAIGAVAGHVSVGFIDSYTGHTLDSSTVSFFAGATGGAIAALAGDSDDVQQNFGTGQTTATNAVDNNYLNARAVLAALAKLNDCNTTECALLRKSLARDTQQAGEQTTVGSLQDRCRADPSGCAAQVLDIKKGLDYLQTPQAREILGVELVNRLIARQSQDLSKALDALQWGAEHIESSRKIVKTLLGVGALALGGGVAVALVRTIGAACASGALSPGCIAVVTDLGIVAADTAGGVPVSVLAAPGLAAVAADRLAAAAARGDAALAREVQLIQQEARAATVVAAKEGTLLLGAPRQIEAAWGASTYRHGGLMSGIEHVMYRHGANSGFANVGRYTEGTRIRDVSAYVDSALRYGTVSNTGKNAYTVEHNLGRVIGTDQAGNAASSIRVHVRDGVIQTAFPF